jgi:hypothetical protein
MARKLRPDEVQAFDENPNSIAPVSEFEMLLRKLIEKPDDVLDLTTINPAWIKGSPPESLDS